MENTNFHRVPFLTRFHSYSLVEFNDAFNTIKPGFTKGHLCQLANPGNVPFIDW